MNEVSIVIGKESLDKLLKHVKKHNKKHGGCKYAAFKQMKPVEILPDGSVRYQAAEPKAQ